MREREEVYVYTIKKSIRLASLLKFMLDSYEGWLAHSFVFLNLIFYLLLLDLKKKEEKKKGKESGSGRESVDV